MVNNPSLGVGPVSAKHKAVAREPHEFTKEGETINRFMKVHRVFAFGASNEDGTIGTTGHAFPVRR